MQRWSGSAGWSTGRFEGYAHFVRNAFKGHFEDVSALREAVLELRKHFFDTSAREMHHAGDLADVYTFAPQ